MIYYITYIRYTACTEFNYIDKTYRIIASILIDNEFKRIFNLLKSKRKKTYKTVSPPIDQTNSNKLVNEIRFGRETLVGC